MKIKKNRILTIDKFYKAEEIKELYYNKEINLASYNEAIDFIRNHLTTEEIIKNHYQWFYKGEHLCYLSQNRKLCSHQLIFYFKDEHGNLKVMISSKYNSGIRVDIYNDNIFEDYKFMALT